MNDQELINELLVRVETFTTIRLESRMIPHPLDPDIETLIETWTHLPLEQRQNVTKSLTEKQQTRLFQFTHRIPPRMEAIRRRTDKLALARLGVLANTIEGFGEDFRTNIMSLDLFVPLIRPQRDLTPVWEEAIGLADAGTRERLVSYAEPWIKEKAKADKKANSSEGKGE